MDKNLKRTGPVKNANTENDAKQKRVHVSIIPTLQIETL